MVTERWGLPLWLRACWAAGVALGAGLALHYWVVRRVPLAAFLLNGRLPEHSRRTSRSKMGLRTRAQ